MGSEDGWGLKRYKAGPAQVFVRGDDTSWYVIVGTLAVCNHHGPPHVHGHQDRSHAEHRRRAPVNPALNRRAAVGRAIALWRKLQREPTFLELAEALQ